MNDIYEVVNIGMQVSGKAATITQFIERLELEKYYIPYGYVLRTIYKPIGSDEMIAYLYKIGEEF